MGKNEKGCAVAGVFCVLVGLWGGSYIFFEYNDAWFNFPAYVTSYILVVAGCGLVIAGIKRVLS